MTYFSTMSKGVYWIKFQKIGIVVTTLIIFNQLIHCNATDIKDTPQEIKKTNNEEVDKVDHGYKVLEKQEKLPQTGISNNNEKAKSNVTRTSKKKELKVQENFPNSSVVPPKVEPFKELDTDHLTSLNSGALFRAIYVMLGLSVLVMAYIIFRSFRLGKPKTQMVRKYGILAHRQDVEMRPLPLDEDEEDDTTVFDATNIASQTQVS